MKSEKKVEKKSKKAEKKSKKVSKKKKVGSNITTIILILIFLVGLSVMLYPTVSNYINQRNQSRAIATYDEKVSEMKPEDYSKYFEAAEKYNKELAEQRAAFFNPDRLKGYENILDITGTGIMGYITIKKLGVELPIYHGTDEGILQIAAGHLKGTSFPIGGESTHSVISAHRGLPSAKLFTDLDKMEVGDTFTITVLNREITYEVDSIFIVLPTATDNLQIEDKKDYCTLMTCTPYGINTHRLLVRGHCIGSGETQHIHVTNEAFQIDPTITASVIGIVLLILLLVRVLIHTRRNGRGGRRSKRKQMLMHMKKGDILKDIKMNK